MEKQTKNKERARKKGKLAKAIKLTVYHKLYKNISISKFSKVFKLKV